MADAPGRLAPPAVPVSAAQEGWAWALAVLPLVTAIVLAPLILMGLHRNWVTFLLLLASAGLVVIDKRSLVRSGRIAPPILPSTAWFLVPPVYLRKRANRLGQKTLQFWISIACAVAAPVVGNMVVAVIAITQQASQGLPACDDRAATQDVMNAFDSVDAARQAGVRGVSLSEQEEVGQGPGKIPRLRYCTASVLASDSQEYAVDYTFEQRPDQVIVRLEIRSQR